MALLQTHSFYRCHLTGFYTGAEMFGSDNIWLVIDTQVALTDFHEDEAKKNFLKRKIQNGRLKKIEFFNFVSFQFFF